jgi:hypothetical protein
MNKLYELLLSRKKEFDYTIFFLSFLVLCFTIVFRHTPSSVGEALLEIISPMLVGLCILGLWAWYRSSRYNYYSRKIRKTYIHQLHRQAYKLKKLSSLEMCVFDGLLRNASLNEIAMEQKLPCSEIYRSIDILITKLDIDQYERTIDIDWQNAAGN